MKTLAICHPAIKNLQSENFFEHVTIEGGPITIGLIECDTLELPKAEKFKHYVLVEKKAFSCNYRDKTLILGFQDKCQEKTSDSQLFYSPFGSEFVAEVIDTGVAVSTLNRGDRVIPDGSYPARLDGTIGGLPTNHSSQRTQIFHENQLLKIPYKMPDEVGASFTIGAQTSYSMMRKLTLFPGANVLVTAASSNTSLFILECLKSKDINAFVLSSSERDIKSFGALNIKGIIPSPLKDPEGFKDAVNRYGHFDVVIDPFFDLYMSQILKAMNYNSCYITCGLLNQNSLFEQQLPALRSQLEEVMLICMLRNITIIGNCLGTSNDLQRAVQDYELRRLNVKIDSCFTGNDIKLFFERSFNTRSRFGKVVYKYEN